jgi:hypothetical protein
MREKMEFEAATGELVRRREVEDAAYEIGVMFREHMIRAAETIGLQVAARFGLKETDVASLVSDGISQALRRLHSAIRGNEWGFDSGLDQASSSASQAAALAESDNTATSRP